MHHKKLNVLKQTKWIFFLIVLLTTSLVHAQNRVVVIPLGGLGAGVGSSSQPLKNVVTVSPQNGDFTDPVSALNSITDASSTNPYTIVIGPGVYYLSQTVEMKEWVSIYGAGIKSTFLKVSGVGNAVSGADNCVLADLTVDSNGSGLSNNSGMYNFGTSPLVQNVEFYVHSGSNMHGIYNISSAAPVFEHVTVGINGSSSAANGMSNWYTGTIKATDLKITVYTFSGTATGITNNLDSSLELEQAEIIVTGSGTTSTTIGIENKDSAIELYKGKVSASGQNATDAVYLDNATSFTASDTAFKAVSQTQNARGMYSTASNTTLLQSSITATTTSGAYAIGMELDGYTHKAQTVSIETTSPSFSTGVKATNAYLDFMGTTVGATGSSNDTKGFDVIGGNSVLQNGNISASSGGETYGVYNDFSTMEIRQYTIDAYSGSFTGHGIYSTKGGSVSVYNSTVSGSTFDGGAYSLSSYSSIRAFFSELLAPATGTGALQCNIVVNSAGTSVSTTTCN